jgi:predicted membrane protein
MTNYLLIAGLAYTFGWLDGRHGASVILSLGCLVVVCFVFSRRQS